MTLGMKITNFHYANMAMPAPQSEYAEWPKWVYMDGYPGVMAKDAEEEAALLARPVKEGGKPLPPPIIEPEKIVEKPTVVLSGDNDERAILIQIAEEKRIQIDKRWKTDKIRRALEMAQPQAEGENS